MNKVKEESKRNVYGWLWVTAYLLVIFASLINKAIISVYNLQLAYGIGIILLVIIILLTRNLFNKREYRKKYSKEMDN